MASERTELSKVSTHLDTLIHSVRDFTLEAARPSESSSSCGASRWRMAEPSRKGKEKEGDGLQAITELVDKLLVLEDALDGIKTHYDDKQWTRDASEALDIDKRLPRDDVRFQTIHMLCRCLTRLASVYYLVETKLQDTPDLSQKLLTKLEAQAVELVSQHRYLLSSDPIDTLTKPASFFHEAEQDFNKHLVEVLRQADLLTGIHTQKQAEKLLFHCKNLYAVLRPARTVVTVTMAPRDGGRPPVYLKTTNTPITQKTPEQHEALKALQIVGSTKGADGKTLHRSMPIAMQEISALFIPLLANDKTMLPAQARKFIAHTVKNAWRVEETLSKQNPLTTPDVIPCKNTEGQACTLTYLRSGSPAPTATVPEQELLDSTRENLRQIQNPGAREGGAMPRLCVFNLMTRIDYQYQKQVIDVERWFAGDADVEFKSDSAVLGNLGLVVAPTAFHGKAHAPIVSQSAQIMFGLDPVSLPNMTMESAIKMVSEYASSVLHKDGKLLIHCASGQDRTHTAILRLLGDWFGPYLRQQFASTALGAGTRAQSGYENAFVRLFILGNVGPFLNSIMVPGAPGLKSDSKEASVIPLTDGEQQKAVLGQLYLKSASRNKQNALPKDIVSDVLLRREKGDKAFFNAMTALLDTVEISSLDARLREHWLAVRNAAKQAAEGRYSDIEAKALRDGIYRITELFKPYTRKAATPDDMAFIARELCAIGSSFRKQYYRPAVNNLGIVLMSVGIAIVAASLTMLCLAFIPGSPLLLALSMSANLFAKLSLIATTIGLIASGVGAGVFGGERSLRFHNHFTAKLKEQADVMVPKQPEPAQDEVLAPESSDDDERPKTLAPGQS